jgi:hypothetical protein
MTFLDEDGVTWDVWEVPPGADVDDARGWLYFFSADGKRRLSPYPEGWALLSPRALGELCRRAVPVSCRRIAIADALAYDMRLDTAKPAARL